MFIVWGVVCHDARTSSDRASTFVVLEALRTRVQAWVANAVVVGLGFH